MVWTVFARILSGKKQGKICSLDRISGLGRGVENLQGSVWQIVETWTQSVLHLHTSPRTQTFPSLLTRTRGEIKGTSATEWLIHLVSNQFLIIVLTRTRYTSFFRTISCFSPNRLFSRQSSRDLTELWRILSALARRRTEKDGEGWIRRVLILHYPLTTTTRTRHQD